jgi:hypothetical protein
MNKRLIVFLFGFVIGILLLSNQTFAQSQVSIGIAAGYPKGNNNFDVVVKDKPGTNLVMYVNDKNPNKATVNKDDWATFRKVSFIDSGKVSFTKSIKNGFFSSREIPINYSEFYRVTNGNLYFYQNNPTKTNPIGVRTKTTGCVISPNLEQDKACTPGAIFSNATKDMVCKSGYSSSVRDVSNSEKNQVFAEYGVKTHTSGQYEVDHLVSLELGGSNDIANLWPEAATPTPGFHEKDKVENKLHSEVCNGTITLAVAQQEIANDWLKIYVSLYPAVATAPTPKPAAITNVTPTVSTPSAPAEVSDNGHTALCVDGTYSDAVNHQGACSHHGGVSVWYK